MLQTAASCHTIRNRWAAGFIPAPRRDFRSDGARLCGRAPACLAARAGCAIPGVRVPSNGKGQGRLLGDGACPWISSRLASRFGAAIDPELSDQ
ncbi:protein of unassigned function [Methylobacterium oryzae CBMB20]|uniref:Protein of unassigned function n=1 Tax=Methylobacterium oryzae CBMB20 TaxID=693986 RepID=A0A089NSJ3_9HYPH|nr:protein of unassigned function [Methylobacterium oryzae CBMB20]